MTPTLYLMAGTAVVSGMLAFGTAWQVQDWRHTAALHDVAIASEALRKQNQSLESKAADAFASGQAAAKAREVAVEKEVIRVVSKPEYRNDCLDDDGLRILTSDISTANSRRRTTAVVPSTTEADGQVKDSSAVVVSADDSPVR